MFWNLFSKKKEKGKKPLLKTLKPPHAPKNMSAPPKHPKPAAAVPPAGETQAKPATTFIHVKGKEHSRLGELLLESKLISWETLQKALAVQEQTKPRKFLGEVLIEMNLISEETLVSYLSQQSRLPYIKINAHMVPKELLKEIPLSFIETNQLMPIDKIGKVLIVAMVNPNNKDSISNLENLTGYKVKPVICRLSEFKEVITILSSRAKTMAPAPAPAEPPREQSDRIHVSDIPFDKTAPSPVKPKDETAPAACTVTDDEFRHALRSLSNNLSFTWKNFDNRIKPKMAEKVQDDEFNLFTSI
jgi:hypothetical protein